MRFRRVLSQAVQGLGRNLTMTIAGVLTVMIALLLLAGALVVRSATNEIRNELVNQLNVSVYLDPAITQTEQTAIYQSLTGLPQVKSVTFISQQQAYQLFRKIESDQPALVKITKPSEIPPSFVVKLYNPKNFPVVYSAMGCSANGCSTPGVQNVGDVSSVINRVLRLLHGITLGALVVSIAMLLIAGLLIYNAMQVSAFSRRRETGIMRLVGASDLSIQAPFVLEGVTIGLVGSLLAFGLLMVGRLWVDNNVALGALSPFGDVGRYVATLPWVLIVGVGLSAVLSFLTLQRHLRV
jgi:cell division transport system permease protein